MPQKWETPSWEFDLLIPLINENYSMSAIASESNDIQIAQPDSSNFIIELKETVIDSGVNYLMNEAWITSRNDNIDSASRIIFEFFHKDELRELFKDFTIIKIYSSSIPASLTRDAEEISSRDSYWVLALR